MGFASYPTQLSAKYSYSKPSDPGQSITAARPCMIIISDQVDSFYFTHT